MLDTKPWLFLKICIKNFSGVISKVGVGWDELLIGGVFPGEGLGEDEDIVTSKEGVGVEGNWLDDDLRVFCRGHVAGRPVKVPLWKLRNASDLLLKGSVLGSEGQGSVDPDVSGDDPSLLVDVSQEVQRVVGVSSRRLHLQCCFFKLFISGCLKGPYKPNRIKRISMSDVF